MSTEEVTLEILKLGRVAVIESASDTAHYPQFNRGAFAGLDLPWICLEYFDESELEDLFDEPLERKFAAVVFTAGAIALPCVRALVEQYNAVLTQALTHGVGLVITATSLGGLDRFDLTFLPEGSQVSLVNTEMRTMAGTLVTDLSNEIISEADGRRARSALTLAAGHALGWSESATLHRPGGQIETVGWRAQFGLARVIISVLPFEWICRDHIVQTAIVRASQSRGVLIIGRSAAPPWYGDVEPGQFLARVSRTPLESRDLLAKFSHVRLCTDAAWDIDGLDRPALLARLENGGTVEFPTDGPAGQIFARLDGVPRYVSRLHDAQNKIIERIGELPSSPTFHLLAFALLAAEARTVVRGRLYVPDMLRMDAVSSVIVSAMTRRVKDGSVDGLLLPTVNLLAACTICGVDDGVVASMEAWIATHADLADDNQLAQARWALWAAGRSDILTIVPAPQIEPDSVLGQLACELDDGDLEPINTYIGNTPPLRSHRLGPLSDLDRAILAYTHARWGLAGNSQAVWNALTSSRLDRPSRTGAPVNIEELCYRTAAQILLDAHAPLTIHPNRALPLGRSVPREVTELLTRQAAAELGAYEERQARQSLARISQAARIMAGILGALTVILGLTLASLPLWLPAAQGLDVEVRLTLCATLLLITSTAFTVATATDTAQGVAPEWLRATGQLIRHFRR